jgi:uncharacterized protein YndB with AHSA1/START domain
VTTPSTFQVRVCRTFAASPERVFEPWLDAEQARRWLVVAAAVQPARGVVLRMDIDARVGGSFRVVDLRDGQQVEHVGEYLEIDRPRRLVFTWGVPRPSANRDRVAVEVVPRGGGCELTVTHAMRSGHAEHAARAEQGWSVTLDALAATLG